MLQVKLRIPYSQGRLISLFHEHGVVRDIRHTDAAVVIEGSIPIRYGAEFEPFIFDRVPAEPAEESSGQG